LRLRKPNWSNIRSLNKKRNLLLRLLPSIRTTKKLVIPVKIRRRDYSCLRSSRTTLECPF
jgi:hypothetical protein